jgi:hypothetical protein
MRATTKVTRAATVGIINTETMIAKILQQILRVMRSMPPAVMITPTPAGRET